MIKNRCQNRPLEPLRTLLEARSLLGALICTFLAPFGTPKGPQNRSKIDHFLDLFLNDFWEPLFHAFGLHLGSQNDPKMRPKREPRPEHENHRFCCYLVHLSHIEGSRKSSFLMLFWMSLGPFQRRALGHPHMRKTINHPTENG